MRLSWRNAVALAESDFVAEGGADFEFLFQGDSIALSGE